MICSQHSEDLGEDQAGSAPPEPLILVIEQPGPWGRDAVSESGLHPIAGALNAHAAQAGARIQVVRRQTRRYALDRPAAWLAGVTAGNRFLERLDIRRAEDLLALDLVRGAGEPDPDLLLLACTHSTRDPCCARRGLPLHRALTATGTRTWHASHLGGHRFAATMAALPLGAWLGRVPAGAAAEVTTALKDDRLPLAYMRGLAGLEPAAQAAELTVRRARHLDHIDAVRVERSGGGSVDLVTDDGARHRAEVRLEPTGIVRALSCGDGAKTEDPGRWAVSVSTMES